MGYLRYTKQNCMVYFDMIEHVLRVLGQWTGQLISRSLEKSNVNVVIGNEDFVMFICIFRFVKTQ